MASRLITEALISIRESVREANILDESVSSQALSLARIRIPAVAVEASPAMVTRRE